MTALSLQDIRVSYGPMAALHGLSMDVGEAEIVALIGSNGAGKTTTLRAIMGLTPPDSGAISFDNRDISGMRPPAVVGLGIALSPEGRRVFPQMTVEENLQLGAYLKPDKAQAKASMERVYGYFPRLLERRTQMAGSMSGGEQQMLAIGRALMAEPRLLMIDEVSLGLMPAMVDVCYGAIAALKADGMTILLVEQSTQRAFDVADDVCVLESGRTVWRGTAADARNDPGLIDAYLGLKS